METVAFVVVGSVYSFVVSLKPCRTACLFIERVQLLRGKRNPPSWCFHVQFQESCLTKTIGSLPNFPGILPSFSWQPTTLSCLEVFLEPKNGTRQSSSMEIFCIAFLVPRTYFSYACWFQEGVQNCERPFQDWRGSPKNSIDLPKNRKVLLNSWQGISCLRGRKGSAGC